MSMGPAALGPMGVEVQALTPTPIPEVIKLAIAFPISYFCAIKSYKLTERLKKIVCCVAIKYVGECY